jgi:DNA-binding LytR/AlgR family response regulator
MRTVRAAIAEDDTNQAEGIASLLSQLRPSWQVQALVHDRAHLSMALEEVVPDILLLDLHMPEQPPHPKDVLDIVKASPFPPVVILITGDPSKALQAYESAVADYIVKPVRPARLAQALERAEGVLYAKHGRQTGATTTVTKGSAAPQFQWLSGSRGRDVVMIEPTDIIYLQADRKYTTAVLADGHVLMRDGISDIEAKLDTNTFMRIHRSTIINVKRIDFLRRDEMGRLRIHMKGRPEGLIVSRTFEYVFKGI